MPAFEATGTTVTYSGFTGEILSFDGPSETLEMFDVGHFGSTGAMPKKPRALYDVGPLTLTINHDGTNPRPTLGGAGATLTIGFNGGGTASGNAVVAGYGPDGQMGDRMTSQITFEFTGAITWDDGEE